MPDMQRTDISYKDVIQFYKEHSAKGHHVNKRLWDILDSTKSFGLITINNLGDYINLIWQANDHTRALTPEGQSRTLRDCVQRIQSAGGSFQALAKDGHSWFESCINIEQCFDFHSFGWLAIQDANVHERKESPEGSYYVFDGVHRSIVLAKLLVEKKIDFEPIKCLHVERSI